jgi:hypothetical protein
MSPSWTDTAIEKSGTYTITGDSVSMAHVGTNKIRLLSPRYFQMVSNLILLPAKFSPDQITSLADVEHIDVRILASVAALALPAQRRPSRHPDRAEIAASRNAA